MCVRIVCSAFHPKYCKQAPILPTVQIQHGINANISACSSVKELNEPVQRAGCHVVIHQEQHLGVGTTIKAIYLIKKNACDDAQNVQERGNLLPALLPSADDAISSPSKLKRGPVIGEQTRGAVV
jgi:hypothetical protein